MTLRAGAAAIDISPAGAVPLFGYPHVPRVATGIHDGLLASALYLDNGRGKVILVALDLLLLDASRARAIRRAVAERTGVPEERVMISCTHTHSGPVTAQIVAWSDDPTVPPADEDYLEGLTEQVVEATTRAMGAARPAELAWTTADASGVGGNRLVRDGLTDPEVGIVLVREAGGRNPLAVAMIYGMHPTVLHEDSTLVSADFPHYARQVVRERFGAELPVVYHMGPSGNQSPRYTVSGQTFAEAERLGRKLGEAVVESVERLGEEDFLGGVRLGGALGTLELPRRRFPGVAEAQLLLEHHGAELRRLRAERAETGKVRTAECAVFGAEGTLRLAQLQAEGVLERALDSDRPIELQVLEIGEVSLVGLPGEWFTEYSLELKRRWPKKAFVISLVNGHLQGYIATAEAVAGGSYEALTAVYDGPVSAARMMDAAMKLLAVVERT